MEHGRERVLCILRRFGRVSYSRWWAYHPEKALPQERRFDLLDANEKKTGEFCYISFNAGKESFIDAPWGQTKIFVKNRLKALEGIEIEGRSVAEVRFSPLKNDVIFDFPNGVVMRFDAQFIRDDMKYKGETGTIAVVGEQGGLESRQPTEPQLPARNDKKAAENDLPRSYETDSYRQWRILCSGITPVDERDVQVALVMYISSIELVREALECPPGIGIVSVLTGQK